MSTYEFTLADTAMGSPDWDAWVQFNSIYERCYLGSVGHEFQKGSAETRFVIFTKAEVQEFKNLGLSHNTIATNLEDQTCLEMMVVSSDTVQINFVGYLLEPWGLSPYYEPVAAPPGFNHVAKKIGIIYSRNDKYDPDDNIFRFNGESLFVLVNHISNIEISCCDSGHSFDYGLLTIGGFLKMCDVQKGGVSLYETARQEVVVEGLDLEGSLVEDCEENIFFATRWTPVIQRGSLISEHEFQELYSTKVIDAGNRIIRPECRQDFGYAFELGYKAPDWVYDIRAPNLMYCVKKARKLIWNAILSGSTIANVDATGYDDKIIYFLMGIWTSVVGTEVDKKPEEFICWVRDVEGRHVTEALILNILCDTYNQLFTHLYLKFQEKMETHLGNHPDGHLQLLCNFFEFKNNFHFSGQVERQPGSHDNTIIRSLMSYVITRQASFNSDGTLLVERAPRAEADKFIQNIPNPSCIQAYVETLVIHYLLKEVVPKQEVQNLTELQNYWTKDKMKELFDILVTAITRDRRFQFDRAASFTHHLNELYSTSE